MTAPMHNTRARRVHRRRYLESSGVAKRASEYTAPSSHCHNRIRRIPQNCSCFRSGCNLRQYKAHISHKGIAASRPLDRLSPLFRVVRHPPLHQPLRDQADRFHFHVQKRGIQCTLEMRGSLQQPNPLLESDPAHQPSLLAVHLKLLLPS